MIRTSIVLLLAGALCVSGMMLTSLPIRADGAPVIDFGTDPPPTTEPGETPAVPETLPTKVIIREIYDTGDFAAADVAYQRWASYWGEDDPALLVLTQRAVLTKQYQDGKFEALVAMAKAGDTEATTLLRNAVLATSTEMPPETLATSIRLLAMQGDKSLLNTLRLALYMEDPAVVQAAIDALGYLGDTRAVPDLLELLAKADPARSVAVARSLYWLGAGKQVQKQFLPQLEFPLQGAREKAALVLAATNNPEGWPIIQKMLTEKQAPYYPLALSVLTAVPSDESRGFLTTALAGSEEEQLAALQSTDILPAEKLDPLLLRMLRDAKSPAAVREASLARLVARGNMTVLKDVRAYASNLGKEVPASLKVAAINALGAYGLMESTPVREMIRQRVAVPDESDAELLASMQQVSLGARTALLRYGLNKPQ